MYKRIVVAALAAMAGGMPGAAVAGQQAFDEPQQAPYAPGYGSPGKGKGRRPHHSSARFVAQDKRDARKARNRSRS